LRLRALDDLPPALERRFIAFPCRLGGIVAARTAAPEVAYVFV
jgi:hypothetical protein